MKHVLGIDPGNNSGAAVLLNKHDNVVAWWTWKRLIRKAGDVCRVDCSDGNAVCLAHMWEIGDTIARYLSEKNLAPTFALERLFVPRPRRGQRPVNPQSPMGPPTTKRPVALMRYRVLSSISSAGMTALTTFSMIPSFSSSYVTSGAC